MNAPLHLADYDFALPPEQIAQEPAAEREDARLLVLDRASGALAHRGIRDLPALLHPGDLLVVNATRVEPARLRGRKASGAAAEALLLRAEARPGEWRALVRTRALRVGTKLGFARDAATLDAESGTLDAESATLDAEVTALHDDGSATLRFPPEAEPHRLGEAPLPPYIERPAPRAADAERYQTVFARVPGAVAAPTAGLHLGRSLLATLAERGVAYAEVVLHVGPGTFRPLRESDLAAGRLHPERFELPEATAAAVRATRARGGRVAAVGTTTTRVLEACATDDGAVEAGAGETDLFLRPGSRFRVVDALLTNFHLPRSSLLLLVAAFAGRERVLDAYAAAVRSGYRFYSYGDAMWIA